MKTNPLTEILQSVFRSIFKTETLPWWLIIIIGAIVDIATKLLSDAALMPNEVYYAAGAAVAWKLRTIKFKRPDDANLPKQAMSATTPQAAYTSDALRNWSKWLDGKTPFSSAAIITSIVTILLAVYSFVSQKFTGVYLVEIPPIVFWVLNLLNLSFVFNAKEPIQSEPKAVLPEHKGNDFQ